MTFASSSSVPPSGSSKDSSNVATHGLKSLKSRPLATDMLPGLPVVQVKPMALGTPKFEEKRAALLEAFAAKVPAELRLPLEVIQNPPTDVTSIPTTCGILSPEEIIIIENYDAVGLLEAIARRKHTAVVSLSTFLCRCCCPSADQRARCGGNGSTIRPKLHASLLDAETLQQPLTALHKPRRARHSTEQT